MRLFWKHGRKKKESLILEFKADIESAAKHAIEEVEEAISSVEFQEERAELHEKLLSLRMARVADDAEREHNDAKELEAKLEAQKRKEALMQRKIERDRKRIHEWRESLDNEAQKQLEAEQYRRTLDLEKYQEEVEHNRNRLIFRKKEHTERLVMLNAVKIKKQNEQNAKREAMKQFFLRVAPQVERDPSRVIQETKSTTMYSKSSNQNSEHEKPLFPVHGYTIDRLMKDPKFKVSQALAEAGMHNTDYGRHVIKNTRAFKQTRVDNLTIDQRERAQKH